MAILLLLVNSASFKHSLKKIPVTELTNWPHLRILSFIIKLHQDHAMT